MSYPIHITNIYELLNEDGEQTPQVRVNVTDQQKAPAKSTGTQAKGTSGSGKSSDNTKPKDSSKPKDSVRRDRPPRNDRPPRRDNQGGDNFYRNSNNNNNTGATADQTTGSNTPLSPSTDQPFRREGGDNRGERRSRGAPAGGFHGNKRVYDRRSGTGRGKEVKKGGGGRGGWGKEGEGSEATLAEEVVATEGESKETTETKEEKVEEKDEFQEERERLQREEDEKEAKLMTLDDYLKKRSEKAPVVQLPQERKANEGTETAESKKWKSYEVLKRDEDDDTEVQSEGKDKKKKEKNTVRLDEVFNVKEPQRKEDRPFRGRGGRSNRGGDRGSRGGDRGDRGDRGNRGGERSYGSRGGRGKRNDESAPAFDLNSFPKLN